ncbi:hypothetical protein CEXT_751711 [Caerostris extrusa]|uniref:Uncharacterized protein n=1 Tax=Caerostris extrusa TaxID=172846 RepID=A0AAV4NML7_CAEEX|nr:hypothetical protein CEXT_751711 [Caerostris extrusa]
MSFLCSQVRQAEPACANCSQPAACSLAASNNIIRIDSRVLDPPPCRDTRSCRQETRRLNIPYSRFPQGMRKNVSFRSPTLPTFPSCYEGDRGQQPLFLDCRFIGELSGAAAILLVVAQL